MHGKNYVAYIQDKIQEIGMIQTPHIYSFTSIPPQWCIQIWTQI